jgi:hypothetical protein
MAPQPRILLFRRRWQHEWYEEEGPGATASWTVWDSDGNPFDVPLQVWNSSGTVFNVPEDVWDSDGNVFTPI